MLCYIACFSKLHIKHFIKRLLNKGIIIFIILILVLVLVLYANFISLFYDFSIIYFLYEALSNIVFETFGKGFDSLSFLNMMQILLIRFF